MKKTKNSKHSGAWFWSLGIGVGTFIASLVVLLIVSTICIGNEYFSLDSFAVFVPALHFVSMLISSIVVGILNADNKERSILINVGLISLLMLSAGLMFFEGITIRFWLSIVAVAIAALLAIILERQKKYGASAKRARSHRR